MSDMLEGWQAAAPADSEVTVKDLDDAAILYTEEREEYDRLTKISKEYFKKVESAKYKLLNLMEVSNKTKIIVDGVGTFSRVQKKSYKVPKDFESKKLVIDYFHSLGEHEFYQFVSVASGTLNSYVKAQLEEDPTFSMQGCGEPSISSDLRIKKGKK